AVGPKVFSTGPQSSVKASLGDALLLPAFNAEFSFPVLNLVDPVLLSLLDSQGTILSQTCEHAPTHHSVTNIND
ncbi:unnamed protein product, partial [Closterium sp. NIES-54]